MGRILTLSLVGTGALRRPRRVQRRNLPAIIGVRSARYCAGGDIAARCPYLFKDSVKRRPEAPPGAFNCLHFRGQRGNYFPEVHEEEQGFCGENMKRLDEE